MDNIQRNICLVLLHVYLHNLSHFDLVLHSSNKCLGLYFSCKHYIFCYETNSPAHVFLILLNKKIANALCTLFYAVDNALQNVHILELSIVWLDLTLSISLILGIELS